MLVEMSEIYEMQKEMKLYGAFPQKWVFGGTCYQSQNAFLSQSGQTSVRIIQKCLCLGSTVPFRQRDYNTGNNMNNFL
jgi:hypothetical protein